PSFTIVDFEDGTMIKKEVIDNPGHHPGFLPEFLSKSGVDYIVAGGMGQRAQMLFAEKNIKTIMGISGTIEEIIEKIQKGTLKGGESLCKPGAGKGYGLDKTECEHGEEEA
ncbi:MAG: NifB/NifX family molybdenum-iron cluster-binding protein, partial [Candidatus Omnitrophota bacterium]